MICMLVVSSIVRAILVARCMVYEPSIAIIVMFFVLPMALPVVFNTALNMVLTVAVARCAKAFSMMTIVIRTIAVPFLDVAVAP